MRVIEILEKVMEYNELLAKAIKAEIWFSDPKIEQSKKDNFYPKYEKVWKRLGELSEEFDRLGITYNVKEDENEVMEGIELPESLKRKDIEGLLENWHKHLREKEKEKIKVGV